ncbi:MAG: ABC transporter substrate binding protein [Pseudomonadota bacterium]
MGLRAISSDRRRAFAWPPVALLGLLLLSGCSVLSPLDTGPEPPPVADPQLPPKPEPLPELPSPRPDVAAPATPAPVLDPTLVETEEPLRVSVLLSSRLPAYERIAIALRAELGQLDVYDMDDRSLTPREMHDSIRAAKTEVIVAVGYKAAVFATRIDDMPVVFSQVFNTDGLDLESSRVRGVSVLPPLDQQLEVWRTLNPNLSAVGAIVGAGHELLVEEAGRAADAHSVRFQHRVAQSDRETLYLFTRLVPEIDGFWLFPDNRILSSEILKQMLTYAARHRVQVAVFNDSLLSIGATLSTTPVDADVAATIRQVAEQLVAPEGADLPPISPLSDIAVRVSEASRNGLVSENADASRGED